MRSRSFTLKEYSGLATAFLFINSNTNAQAIYTDIDPDIELQFNGETAGIDMDNNGTIDFAFLKTSGEYSFWNGSSSILRDRKAIWAGAYGTSANGIAGIYVNACEACPTYYFPYALNVDGIINDDLSFQSAGLQTMGFGFYNTDGDWHYGVGFWLYIADGYAGVKFLDNDKCLHYGWIRCEILDTCSAILIKDYAYETACNYPIEAGSKESYVSIHVNENTLAANIYSFGNSVFVKLNGASNNAELHVYNLEGKEIFRNELQNQFSEIKLNAPKGIYLVEIITDEGRFAKKVYLD